MPEKWSNTAHQHIELQKYMRFSDKFRTTIKLIAILSAHISSMNIHHTELSIEKCHDHSVVGKKTRKKTTTVRFFVSTQIRANYFCFEFKYCTCAQSCRVLVCQSEKIVQLVLIQILVTKSEQLTKKQIGTFAHRKCTLPTLSFAIIKQMNNFL